MGPRLASAWTQTHPPKPEFTEKNLSTLQGKIYIVTGANTGIGKELARLLYSKDAKVYVAARSEDKGLKAIHDIKEATPSSKGNLTFLHLDLADLNKVKESAQQFLSLESKLNVLFNNAGVMTGTKNEVKTAQGYELNLGVNAIGTFLFTKILTPLLIETAKSEPADSVRVTWPASFGTEMYAEKDIAIDMSNLDYHIKKPATYQYGISKTGTWALGVEFARRYKGNGIVSLPLNPGNLASELARDQPFSVKAVAKLICYPPINGAYTQLFAGLSPEATIEKSGSWVVPFGRFYPIREDLVAATKTEAEGGNGGVKKFWDWVEEQVKAY